MPTYQHEKAVVDYLAKLSKQGWKTINLKSRSPDGIAVKDGKIVAVEILIIGKNETPNNNDMKKRSDYFMFDEVFIKKYRRHTMYPIGEKIFKTVRKEREEEKINEVWDKYD